MIDQTEGTFFLTFFTDISKEDCPNPFFTNNFTKVLIKENGEEKYSLIEDLGSHLLEYIKNRSKKML